MSVAGRNYPIIAYLTAVTGFDLFSLTEADQSLPQEARPRGDRHVEHAGSWRPGLSEGNESCYGLLHIWEMFDSWHEIVAQCVALFILQTFEIFNSTKTCFWLLGNLAHA